MDQLLDNYFNGNIPDARTGAKRFALQRIVDALMERGYSLHAAYDIGNYLKGFGSWEAACQAEMNNEVSEPARNPKL